jgi:hypothetical protein
VARRDFGVDIVPIVDAVTGEGFHKAADPFEQGVDLRAVIGISLGQHQGDDLRR